MASLGLDYSGSYEFVETEMYWRINHEVSTGEKALQCNDCHVENGKLNWQSLVDDRMILLLRYQPSIFLSTGTCRLWCVFFSGYYSSELFARSYQLTLGIERRGLQDGYGGDKGGGMFSYRFRCTFMSSYTELNAGYKL